MIKEYLQDKLSPEQKALIEWDTSLTQALLSQLNHSILDNSFTIGLPYWSKKNPLLVKNFTWLTTKLNLATVIRRRNYASLTFNSTLLDPKAILEYRTHGKLDNFLMRLDLDSYDDDLVKRNGVVMTGGVPRPAFNRAAKSRFMLDTEYLAKYKRPIRQNLIKSIKKGIELGNIKEKFFADKASYRIVVDYCIDNYLDPNAEYNCEYNVSDQRARAIYNVLKRVGNPISSKDFRAMLVVPKEHAIAISKTNTIALNDIYYFIAELTGHKCLGDTEEDKIEAGRLAYEARELPKLNMKSETDRKELHELIWLERIYAKLDKLMSKGIVRWDIPLEIDHSMLT